MNTRPTPIEALSRRHLISPPENYWGQQIQVWNTHGPEKREETLDFLQNIVLGRILGTKKNIHGKCETCPKEPEIYRIKYKKRKVYAYHALRFRLTQLLLQSCQSVELGPPGERWDCEEEALQKAVVCKLITLPTPSVSSSYLWGFTELPNRTHAMKDFSAAGVICSHCQLMTKR